MTECDQNTEGGRVVIRGLPEDVTFEQSPEGCKRNQLGKDLKGGWWAGGGGGFQAQGTARAKVLSKE